MLVPHHGCLYLPDETRSIAFVIYLQEMSLHEFRVKKQRFSQFVVVEIPVVDHVSEQIQPASLLFLQPSAWFQRVSHLVPDPPPFFFDLAIGFVICANGELFRQGDQSDDRRRSQGRRAR